MTIEEYILSLKGVISAAGDTAREQFYIRNGNLLLASIKNRIQLLGLDSSGRRMPGYSTRAGYYTRDQFVKKSAFKPKGKSGKKVFNTTGKEHKSMYLKNGYKELREIQGKPTERRTINYSGDLMLSYVLGVDNKDILLGFNQEKQSRKRRGLEKKNRGLIFAGTVLEIQTFDKNIIAAETDLSKKLFKR